jgi:hypothetical protein
MNHEGTAQSLPKSQGETENGLSESSNNPQIVKVISDGNSAHTRVEIGGKHMMGVVALRWDLNAEDGAGKLQVTHFLPRMDLNVPIHQVEVRIPLPGGDVLIPLSRLFRWQADGVPL